MHTEPGPYPGPLVIAVRGPSRSGKTALAERVIAQLAEHGRTVAYLKRTHHELDLPAKASGRVWARQPAAMVMRAPDRTQLTLPAGSGTAAELLAFVPDSVDLVLLETHTPEPYPTVLSGLMEPGRDEHVVGRWRLEDVDAAAASVSAVILGMLPADRALALALRAAMRQHSGGHGPGHACAGLVLGTRLALLGCELLGIETPDTTKRLMVAAETDRCAVDAIQVVTGCRPGKRTLRLLDYGKLAATFFDEWTGTAVRVAARGDLRGRAEALALTPDRLEAQRLAYVAMPVADLFEWRASDFAPDQFDLPGPPRRRVNCVTCGEEVSDGRDVRTDAGPRCRPCAGWTAHS